MDLLYSDTEIEKSNTAVFLTRLMSEIHNCNSKNSFVIINCAVLINDSDISDKII